MCEVRNTYYSKTWIDRHQNDNKCKGKINKSTNNKTDKSENSITIIPIESDKKRITTGTNTAKIRKTNK